MLDSDGTIVLRGTAKDANEVRIPAGSGGGSLSRSPVTRSGSATSSGHRAPQQPVAVWAAEAVVEAAPQVVRPPPTRPAPGQPLRGR